MTYRFPFHIVCVVASLLSCITLPSRADAAATKGWLGTNDNGNYYWASNGRWADASRSFCGFYAFEETPPGGVKFGRDGYPTTPAMCQSYMDDYPAGVYNVTWDGNARFDFAGSSFVVDATGQSGKLTLTQANQFTFLKVHASDPQKPLHNLHIWAPGYGPGGPVYRKEFLDVLRHFNCVRVMGNQRINDSTEAHWADRIPPTAWDQTSRATPIELLVEEANEANIDLWLCAPAMADDDYVHHMAQLAHACKHRVHIEYGNEDWNWGMPVPWKYNNKVANDPATATPFDGKLIDGKIVPYFDGSGKVTFGTDGNTRSARRIAETARHFGQIFRQAFSDRPGDLSVVLAGQTGWSMWVDEGLKWNVAKFGSTGFDEVAIAGYFDDYWDSGKYLKNPAAPTLDDVFQSINRFLDVDLNTQFENHNQLCQKYGLKLVCYEGGQSLGAPNVDFSTPAFANNLHTLAQTDPRMGAAYTKLFAIAHAHGVTQFEQLGLLGRWDKNGYWSVLRNLNDQTPKNARWQALLAETARSK
jgi:hypothetical protein